MLRRSSKLTLVVTVTYFDEVLKEGVDGEGCALKMDARRVEKVQFPVYEKPGHKDDMVRLYWIFFRLIL